MTTAELEDLAPEIFAIARELRAAAADPGDVRLRCIHDQHGNLVAGKLPDDMAPPGPIPPAPRITTTTEPYRGKSR